MIENLDTFLQQAPWLAIGLLLIAGLILLRVAMRLTAALLRIGCFLGVIVLIGAALIYLLA
ncbi:MAG: hypothetical protein R3300_19695 [Candidatus Promineifilaceae bacterium]|nr:hypothetical protein [Candidatus Promineifilaceae bacterium]